MPYAIYEDGLEARRAYQKTEEGRARHAEANIRWRAKQAKRYKSQNALNNAIRDGKVIPWPVCAVPECDKKPQAHHADYDSPLGVTWLCDAHHKEAHALVPRPHNGNEFKRLDRSYT